VGWFGFVVEDSRIGLVERWRSGFGVGDWLGGWGWGVGFESKVYAGGIDGVGGMNVAGDINTGRQ
jgi:hypothetical protein